MTCLDSEQLIQLFLDPAGEEMAARRAHVNACAECQARLEAIKEPLNQVEHAMNWFDHDHAAERQRLLANLAMDQKTLPCGRKPSFSRKIKEALTMRRTWIGSTVAVLLLVGAFFFWHGLGTPSILAQTARALRQVKSYQCRFQTEQTAPDGSKTINTSKLYWMAPGSLRLESYRKDKLSSVRLMPKDKPGLEIDHRYETFSRLEPAQGALSPVLILSKLGEFAGQADRQLDARTIKGVRAPGYEIALAKIDDNLGNGTVQLWMDATSKLPMQVDIAMESGKIILDEFAWNVPTDGWFTLEPPARYQDKTPTPPDVDKITKDIVIGFKTFAKYGGGKYPRTKMIYGDVTSMELNRNAGLPPRSPPTDKALDKVYWECVQAYAGFGQINMLQRKDSGAIYHGKSVAPTDKDKVLFRWTLNDGRFRVIYGDLHVENVTEARLKSLEGR